MGVSRFVPVGQGVVALAERVIYKIDARTWDDVVTAHPEGPERLLAAAKAGTDAVRREIENLRQELKKRNRTAPKVRQ